MKNVIILSMDLNCILTIPAECSNVRENAFYIELVSRQQNFTANLFTPSFLAIGALNTFYQSIFFAGLGLSRGCIHILNGERDEADEAFTKDLTSSARLLIRSALSAMAVFIALFYPPIVQYLLPTDVETTDPTELTIQELRDQLTASRNNLRIMQNQLTTAHNTIRQLQAENPNLVV